MQPEAGRSFPRRLRLLSRGDFKLVFDDTCCKSIDACLTMLARANGLDYPRLGLAISKRSIRTAVGRNRVKRLIRESFRHHQQGLSGLDIVVLSRQATLHTDNRTLLQSLDHHWRRLARRCEKSSSS